MNATTQPDSKTAPLSVEYVLQEAREGQRWHAANNAPYTAGMLGDCIAAIEQLQASATPNPSQNAVTGSSGTHPVTEGAADNAPPAILKARGDLAVENRNYWQAEAERLRAGLLSIVDCKDQVTRATIREKAAEILYGAREAVRCHGCGSAWTDDDLRAAKAANPEIISCCPERKPLSITEWMARCVEVERLLTVARRRECGVLTHDASRKAKEFADFWAEQAPKNPARREHYTIISDQFRQIEFALSPDTARGREDCTHGVAKWLCGICTPSKAFPPSVSSADSRSGK